MSDRAVSFYINRIDDSRRKLQYNAQMLVHCTSSSDYWWYSKQCSDAHIEIDLWEQKAREEGIYIV